MVLFKHHRNGWTSIQFRKISTCDDHRILQAIVSVADNVTGHRVELLKTNNMWNNPLMIVSADNGGAEYMGNNYPLKGSKTWRWYRCYRASAFANGGLIPEKMQGKKTAWGFYTCFFRLVRHQNLKVVPALQSISLCKWWINTREDAREENYLRVLYMFHQAGTPPSASWLELTQLIQVPVDGLDIWPIITGELKHNYFQ